MYVAAANKKEDEKVPNDMTAMATGSVGVQNLHNTANVNIAVIFMRRLERGGSEHSFGIHVAKLAGMPSAIVKRADSVLHQLEASKNSEVGGSIQMSHGHEGAQLNFFQLDDPVLAQVRDEILHLDVNNLTPLEALNKLNDIKRILRGK